MKKKVNIHWFRRDLRLEDNTALQKACAAELPVQCVFIFDPEIISELPKDDARIAFIYDQLEALHRTLMEHGSSLYVVQDSVPEALAKIQEEYDVQTVYANEDYEPYALQRDRTVQNLLEQQGRQLQLFQDHVIFAKDDILKSDGTPYTVYTPYKKKWLAQFEQLQPRKGGTRFNFTTSDHPFPPLDQLGFKRSTIRVPALNKESVIHYEASRDIPSQETSRIGPHLRFGTVSVRSAVEWGRTSPAYLNELIWREFFIQIMYHFPQSMLHNFKRSYDGIPWRNRPEEFKRWCEGRTGIPLVDAGMNQLNATGYMHNRVRMVVASFLCKNLLIDWRWGEAYFATKLLDYEMASNVGNWQWAAGTGCDAAPYFRVFNPNRQQERFDPDGKYVAQWIGESKNASPICDLSKSRLRAIAAYKNREQTPG